MVQKVFVPSQSPAKAVDDMNNTANKEVIDFMVFLIISFEAVVKMKQDTMLYSYDNYECFVGSWKNDGGWKQEERETLWSRHHHTNNLLETRGTFLACFVVYSVQYLVL